MKPPAMWHYATTLLGDDTHVTLGLVMTLIVVAVALAESRWQVSYLREWKKELEAEKVALQGRVAALEASRDRTNQRVDHLLELLTEVRSDVKRLLERGARDAA